MSTPEKPDSPLPSEGPGEATPEHKPEDATPESSSDPAREAASLEVSDSENDQAEMTGEEAASSVDEASPSSAAIIAETPGPTTIESPQPQISPEAEAKRAEALKQVNRFHIGLLLLLGFFAGSFLASNSDLWMQLATGRLLAEGKYTFGQDPFALTTEAGENQPPTAWVNHSWLTASIFYHLYDGERGFVLGLFKALVGLAIIALLVSLRKEDENSWMGVVCLVLATLALSAHLTMQPSVFSLLMLTIVLWILYHAGVLGNVETPKANWLWGIPILCALWVNLDSWFILGPITLALCLTGVFVETCMGKEVTVPVSKLGLLLGASLLACLLNPHHIGAFQLPSELAYLWVGLVDAGPDSIVGGGRTLRLYAKMNAAGPEVLSPLSGIYWSYADAGLNVAGFASMLLVLLSFLSFAVRIRSWGHQPVGVYWARLFVWFPLMVLALCQYRMLGFFAITGGMFALLNFQEHLAWRATSTVEAANSQRRWANLGTIVNGLALLILLLLAWPGWLNSTIGSFSSHRRVAWGVRPNASLKSAALYLNGEFQAGRLKRGFNGATDIASYCAWYAPGMKYYIDQRHSLFPRQMARYRGIQVALATTVQHYLVTGRMERLNNERSWQAAFENLDIDHVVMQGRSQSSLATGLTQYCWSDGQKLKLLYDDGQTVIACVDAVKRTEPILSLTKRWKEWAFVKPKESPAADEKLDSEDVGLWSQYVRGDRPSPLESSEAQALLDYFESPAQLFPWRYRTLDAWKALSPLRAAGLGSGFLTTLDPVVVFETGYLGPKSDPRALTLIQPSELGAPEAPVLAIRRLREGLQKNPIDERSYLLLAESYRRLADYQENVWADRDLSGKSLRRNLRDIQFAMTLGQAAQINPSNYNTHWHLAQFYFRIKYYDVALEHMQKSLHYLELMGPQLLSPEQLDNLRKVRGGALKGLTEMVKKRQDNFELRTGSLSNIDKFRVAFLLPYKYIGPDGKELVEPKLGLALYADKYLKAALADLSLPEQSRSFAIYWQAQLMLTLGESVALYQRLPGWGKDLGPEVFEKYRVYLSASNGFYKQADEALENMVKIQRQRRKDEIRVQFTRLMVPMASFFGPMARPYLPLIADPHFYGLVSQADQSIYRFNREIAELTMLRGLLHLEAGQPGKARPLLEESLTIVDPIYLPDGAIATHYLAAMRKAAQIAAKDAAANVGDKK